MRSGVDDQRVAYLNRPRLAVMRMPAQDYVEATHARRELEICCQTVVAEQHRDVYFLLRPKLVDEPLYSLVADAEAE